MGPLRLSPLVVVVVVVVAFALVVTLTSADTVVEEGNDFEYVALTDAKVDDAYYDYYADHLYYYEPNLSNTTLRKCLCGLDEIWNGSACEKQDTMVAVLDHFSSLMVVNTTSFGNVTTGGVVCPSGTQHFDLGKNPSHSEHFFILESGGLKWNQIFFTNYCVEHFYSPETGHPNEWYAQICLEPPSVPRCCPTGHSLSPNGTCNRSTMAYKFSPPISVSGQTMAWPLENEEVLDLSCTDSEEMFLLELNNSTVKLEYHLRPHLLWTSPVLLRDQQRALSYCVGIETGREEESTYIAKLCYKSPVNEHQEKCEGKICVRKCCADFELLTSTGCHALPNVTLPFQPKFHDSSNFSEVSPPENLTIVHGVPLCKVFFQLQPHKEKDDEFFLLENGYLYASAFPYPYPPTSYCLDSFFDDDDQLHMLPLVCFQESDKKSPICDKLQLYLYPVLLVISILFLGITLLVYLCVPELHAKVHGKCLLSHVSALLMAYVSLFIVQRTTEVLPSLACKVMASVTHFSFLSAFFWLNVMCFDIWWTLKSMRPVPETGEASRLRFKLYSLYSWGCPLIILVVSIVIQNLPKEYDVVRPDFGEEKCWFKSNISLWAYFYGFVLVLVIANIVFFCQVAYILVVAQNDPILQRTRQQNRERMWLYVKLFMVMGITWLAEVISWQEGTCEAWIFTDIINSLQGVSIFLIFICKRNLLKKVRGKWEPYLRHVKEVVGSKRLSHSKFSTSGTGHTAREQLSFSSSENRPNHSAASHKTVQSQLSFDPSSANRKISTGSLNATTGVQVHTQSNIPMHTIAESTSPEGVPNQTPNGSMALPVDAATEGIGRGIKRREVGDFRRTEDSIAEVPEDEAMEESQGVVKDDAQAPVSVEQKDSGDAESSEPHNGDVTEESKPHNGDVKKESSLHVGDGDSLIIPGGSDSETRVNEEMKPCEITINSFAVPVCNPEQTTSDVDDRCAYPYSQDNQGFTGDEDEPVHV